MRRVLKIGGSLLLRPNLAESLQTWLAKQPPAQTLAIVGGGNVIEAVRELDRRFACDSAWIHWQCVDLLATTHHWLAEQLPAWKRCYDSATFESLCQTRSDVASEAHLLSVPSFYKPAEHPVLPETWSTTTDAIAGWLSVICSADELVLLKSCSTDPNLTLGQLARLGIVDDAILGLENRLPPLRLIDFTSELIS